MYKTSCPFCESEETLPHPEKDQWRVCLGCTSEWNTDLIKVPVEK